MLSIILGSALLFNSSTSCDLSLPEKCDIWIPAIQNYTEGNCPNTRPHCGVQDPEQS